MKNRNEHRTGEDRSEGKTVDGVPSKSEKRGKIIEAPRGQSAF